MARLGEETITKQGYLIKIIEYNKSSDIVVEFQDTYKTKINTTYGSFKKGTIMNPYHPGVFGVGIKGKTHPSRINNKITTEYGLWYSMISRCYADKFHKKEPTYKQCEVCSEWLLFDNFYNWLHEQENYQKLLNLGCVELDKDILVKNNKTYSPDTCCLVPHYINMLFVKANSLRKDNLPIGVRQHEFSSGLRYSAYCTDKNKYIHLGMFDTKENAFYTYKKCKENIIKQHAKEGFDNREITKRCYDAMINYEVEITD